MPSAGSQIHNTVRTLCKDLVQERKDNKERDDKIERLEEVTADLVDKVQLLRISVRYLVKCLDKCEDYREHLQEEYCREKKEKREERREEEREEHPCDCCSYESCHEIDPCDPFEPLDPCLCCPGYSDLGF